jgi:hypothetical protein
MASIFLEDVAELPIATPAIEKIAEASARASSIIIRRAGAIGKSW